MVMTDIAAGARKAVRVVAISCRKVDPGSAGSHCQCLQLLGNLKLAVNCPGAPAEASTANSWEGRVASWDRCVTCGQRIL